MNKICTPMEELAELLEREKWRITGYIGDEETYYSHLYAQQGEVIISVTAPHSGNGFSYLLRADYAATHDKWGNAAYERSFKDVADLFLEIIMQNFLNSLDKR